MAYILCLPVNGPTMVGIITEEAIQAAVYGS